MELKTGGTDLTDFCLVLTPTMRAPGRAADAIRKRFTFLPEETTRAIAAVVAELVQNSVERRPGRPITVTIGLDADEVHGEVSDHDNPAVASHPLANGSPSDGNGRGLVDRLTSRWGVHEGSTDVWFEIPLAR